MQMEITFPGGKKVNAVHNGYTIRTDQPKKDGGDESAPTPFDLFISSLSTCAGYYVLSFCQKREIPVEGLRMTADINWNEQKHLVDRIRMNIQLPDGFPEKYRDAVIKAAEQCTVKRNVFDPPEISISTN